MKRAGDLMVEEAQSTARPLSLWSGIVAVVLLSLNLRPSIAAVGPVLSDIRVHFGLSFGTASLLTAIPDLCMGLVALPAANIAARFGRDRTIVVAIALLGVATALRGMSPNVLTLLVSTFLSGSGIAITGALIAGWVKEHFATRVSFFMGLYATALNAGATMAALATGQLAATTGSWRIALAMWALLAPLGILGWRYSARTSPVAATRTTKLTHAAALPWRNPVVWRIAAYFAASNLLYYSLLAWTVPYLAEAGEPNSSATIMLAALILANTIGSAVAPILARLFGGRSLWLTLCAAFIGIGVAWIAFAPTHFPEVAMSLAGFGIGGGFTFGMTLPIDHSHSPEEAGAKSTLVLLIGYVVASTGPILFGLFRDHTGNFRTSMVFLLVVSAVMAIVSLRMPQGIAHRAPKPKDAAPQEIPEHADATVD